MNDKQYKFPPLTLFNEAEDSSSLIGLNYEFLDEIFSFVENFLNEKELEYKLVGIEYGFNLSVFKFVDNSGTENAENALSKAGYYMASDMYRELQTLIIEQFEIEGVRVTTGFSFRNSDASFTVHIPHKNLRKCAFKSVLNECNQGEPNYCFCIKEDGKPLLLTGKQMQYVLLSAKNNECVKNTINSIITGLITLCSPSDANLIVFSNDDSYDIYNQIPHLVFGEVLKDFKLFPAVYNYIEKQIQVRKKLFEQENVYDIYEYNSLKHQKLSKTFIIIDDFGGIYDAFSDKWNDFAHDISKTSKLAEKYGFYFLIVSPIDKNDALVPLKHGSNTKIAFKVDTPMTSFTVLDDISAASLVNDNEAFVHARFFTRSLNRVVVATLQKSEVESVCNFIKSNNGCESKKHLIEELYQTNAELLKVKVLTEEEQFLELVKTLLKDVLKVSYFSLMGASGILNVGAKQTLKVIDYCLEKKYIDHYDEYNYKPNITRQEFEKIFKK